MSNCRFYQRSSASRFEGARTDGVCFRMCPPACESPRAVLINCAPTLRLYAHSGLLWLNRSVSPAGKAEADGGQAPLGVCCPPGSSRFVLPSCCSLPRPNSRSDRRYNQPSASHTLYSSVSEQPVRIPNKNSPLSCCCR